MSQPSISVPAILVVDDELNMRLFMQTLFKTSGMTAAAARDGAEGLRKARENPPDLIILDVMMPGEGGLLMYRNLKSDERLRSIPVVMCSAVADATFFHSLRLVAAGRREALPEPDAYVEKPPDPERMLALVRGLLARRAGAEQQTGE